MKLVKEYINEKFEEESDPIEDMKIGLSYAIKNYIETHDDAGDVIEGYYTPVQFIIRADDLDKETKKIWIEYLLREGNENIFEWTEDEVYEMYNIYDVKFFPNLKSLPYEDISYKYIDGKYILYASDWSDFWIFFDSNTKIDKKTIREILSGAADELFYSYPPDITLENILSYLTQEEAHQVFMALKPICENNLKEANNAKNLSELFDLIENNNELDFMHSDILNIASNIIMQETENEAFNDLKKAIERGYKMTQINEKGVNLTFIIAEEGLNKLFKANWMEDYLIDYYPPHYGWQGELDVIQFIEELHNAFY